MPTAYVWLEKIWVRPHSYHLYYAQALRMGAAVTNSMNKLARQEVMADVMTMFANRFNAEDEEESLEGTDESDDDTTIE